MIVASSHDAVYFDVDNTLVMHTGGLGSDLDPLVLFTNPYTDESLFLMPHADNIAELVRCKGQGRTIIVWSHGGPLWAEEVIRELELERYVDFVLPKVEIYVDDCKIEDWQFINKYHKAPWGTTVTK